MNGKEWRKATGELEKANVALCWGIAGLCWLVFVVGVLVIT